MFGRLVRGMTSSPTTRLKVNFSLSAAAAEQSKPPRSNTTDPSVW